ncbi:hypothetical protein F5X98DRAFT_334186 [Xylaria grammica]|nr:hypothetical protein F5X98DRAFT_334186 [Xylaria grammica]
MHWSLSTLSMLAWLLSTCDANPIGAHDNIHDPSLADGDDALWKRVRVPSGSGGSDPTELSDLFQVSDGCGLADDWVPEVAALHNAVTTAYQSFSSSQSLRALWKQFFGVTFKSDGSVDTSDSYTQKTWKAIGTRLSGVSQFLAGGGVIGSPLSGKPWIFCNEPGDYAPWNQPAKDQTGNYIPSTVRFDEYGQTIPTDYYTVGQLFPLYAQSSSVRAYFIKAFNGYQFDGSGYTPTCSKPDRYAYTNLKIPGNDLAVRPTVNVDLGQYNRFVVLCPDAFLLSQALNQLHSYPSLAQAVSSSHYPGSSGDPLDRYVPLSGTLYHELYHLTDHNNPSGDPFKGVNQCLNGGTSRNFDTTKNPESFVNFAMAAYMFLHPPSGKDAVLFVGGKPQTKVYSS